MTPRPSLNQRTSGLLLPLSSLPGKGPVGDLGSEAYQFIDFLVAAGQRWWQMLPIQPIGEGNSPYRSPSAFAGGLLYISLDEIRKEGWLKSNERVTRPTKGSGLVDYLQVRHLKENLMRQAFERFKTQAKSADRDALEVFVQKENYWLPDYALFSALRHHHKDRPWTRWPLPIRKRTAQAMLDARSRLADAVGFHQFVQWQFERQRKRLKQYAEKRGVGLIGDVPIFVSPDSADVWAHPQNFNLRRDGNPRVVAGVPPDYFTKTGQLWGNPTYRWNAIAQEDYRWWIERFRRAFDCFDAVRLDHFIGFVRVYEVPAGERTALHGKYKKGPGLELFNAVYKALPKIKFIAEDLGSVTPEVIALRGRWNMPGMHVFQFEWEKPIFEANSVVYTGTHDNDTSRGWFESLSKETQKNVRATLKVSPKDTVSWTMVGHAMRSPAHTVITPVQDLLDLPTEYRVNTPGTANGNWRWRLGVGQLTRRVSRRLKQLTRDSSR